MAPAPLIWIDPAAAGGADPAATDAAVVGAAADAAGLLEAPLFEQALNATATRNASAPRRWGDEMLTDSILLMATRHRTSGLGTVPSDDVPTFGGRGQRTFPRALSLC